MKLKGGRDQASRVPLELPERPLQDQNLPAFPLF